MGLLGVAGCIRVPLPPLCQGACWTFFAVRILPSFLLLESPREFELRLDYRKNQKSCNVQRHKVVRADTE